VLGDLADDVRVHRASEGGPEVPAGAQALKEGADLLGARMDRNRGHPLPLSD
jgi:hypothetical protein